MRTVLAYLRALVADPLYWRVCVTIFGAPLVIVAGIAVLRWHPEGLFEWAGLLIVVALGLYGAYLVFAATLGDDATFAKATRYIDDGGELLGLLIIVVVALVAIPLTIAIRYMKSHESKS